MMKQSNSVAKPGSREVVAESPVPLKELYPTSHSLVRSHTQFTKAASTSSARSPTGRGIFPVVSFTKSWTRMRPLHRHGLRDSSTKVTMWHRRTNQFKVVMFVNTWSVHTWSVLAPRYRIFFGDNLWLIQIPAPKSVSGGDLVHWRPSARRAYMTLSWTNSVLIFVHILDRDFFSFTHKNYFHRKLTGF